jgi:hypothetical protein
VDIGRALQAAILLLKRRDDEMAASKEKYAAT